MASANKVILIGNVTRDPEVRFTPKGTAVTEVGLAINRNYTVDGERREDTTFVEVTVWGRQAEIVEKYVSKGKPLYIEGRLQYDTWDDKTTGEKRNKLRVVCEQLQLLGSPSGGSGGNQGGGGYQQQQDGGAQPPQQQQSQPSAQAQQPAAQAAPPQQQPQSDAPSGGSPAAEGPITDGLDDDDIPF